MTSQVNLIDSPGQNVDSTQRVLVTGATGYLGKETVRKLLQKNLRVRVLARDKSRASIYEQEPVEIVVGDVADAESLARVFESVDIVVHLAADMSGSDSGGRRVTFEGTRNVIDQCVYAGVSKLVHISSCSVYEAVNCRDGQVLDEASPIEPYPKRRGPYSNYKLKAENAVRDELQKGRLSVVILRPGMIYDGRLDTIPATIGHKVSRTIVIGIGSPHRELPLVHISNVAEAIALSTSQPSADGEILNIVDDEKVSKKQYFADVINKNHPELSLISVPYGIVWLGTLALECLCRITGKTPPLTRYRLASSYQLVRIDARKLRRYFPNFRPVGFTSATSD